MLVLIAVSFFFGCFTTAFLQFILQDDQLVFVAYCVIVAVFLFMEVNEKDDLCFSWIMTGALASHAAHAVFVTGSNPRMWVVMLPVAVAWSLYLVVRDELEQRNGGRH